MLAAGHSCVGSITGASTSANRVKGSVQMRITRREAVRILIAAVSGAAATSVVEKVDALYLGWSQSVFLSDPITNVIEYLLFYFNFQITYSIIFALTQTFPYTLLGCLIGVLVYRTILKPRVGQECRCRKCGYILRGLSRPQCSECGEVI